MTTITQLEIFARISEETSKGTLEGATITCPEHKAKFDVTTDKVISGPKIPLMHPAIKDESACG